MGAAQDEKSPEFTMALRGCDVELRHGPTAVCWEAGQRAGHGRWVARKGGATAGEPDSVTILIHTSKTDKFSGGCARTHRASGRAPRCPVSVVARLVMAFPERFEEGSPEHRLPLFRWEDGTRMTREDLKNWVRLMMVAEGLPGKRGNSHSLRSGGATALYAATRDIEVVRRWGRWLGDIAHLYAWDDRQASNQDAERMAQASAEIIAFEGERLA